MSRPPAAWARLMCRARAGLRTAPPSGGPSWLSSRHRRGGRGPRGAHAARSPSRPTASTSSPRPSARARPASCSGRGSGPTSASSAWRTARSSSASASPSGRPSSPASIGIVVSFLLCGFIAIAGKRGSAPTLVLSRAAFGVNGNRVPSVLSWVLTVGWETVLVSLATLATSTVFTAARLERRHRHQGRRPARGGRPRRRRRRPRLRRDHAHADGDHRSSPAY